MNTFSKIISLTILICLIPNVDSFASDINYGPYEVGFESFKTYDDSRPYFLGEDTISRPLLIHFWYPSKEKAKGKTLAFKNYIDLISQRENYDIRASEIEENSFNYVNAYSGFAKAHLGLDTSISVQEILDSPVYAKSGIPIKQIDAGFPLLIYAPSNSKASVQNHMICEYLASHGFMILSVGSAGKNSIQRPDIEESSMAQVRDMEHILSYVENSLDIKYTNLGLFGFSSGGHAITLFQMRNESVDAVFSMDGGQEYGAYSALYRMAEFNLKRANAPYCSVVNNYEDFSNYPLYNSIPASEKYLLRMPYLDHNGFISHWHFFESCSSNSDVSHAGISYDYMSKCALGFFSKYLKSAPSSDESSFLCGLDKEYIRSVNQDYTSITLLCNTLLDDNSDSANRLMNDHNTELFAEETQISILSRLFIDRNIDQSIFLSLFNTENHPDSWKAHYDLAFMYKIKGDTHLAKSALAKAEALNPGNVEVADLLKEIDKPL